MYACQGSKPRRECRSRQGSKPVPSGLLFCTFLLPLCDNPPYLGQELFTTGKMVHPFVVVFDIWGQGEGGRGSREETNC